MRIYRKRSIKKIKAYRTERVPQSLIWSTSAKIKEINQDITGYSPSKEYKFIKNI